jgi:2,4-dienoyl-CoA reductase (NADPH2)
VLEKAVLVFSELCHGCGGCMEVCPKGAITEKGRKLGVIQKGLRNGIEFISATEGTYKSIFLGDMIKKCLNPPIFEKILKKLTGGVKVPTIISGRSLTPSLANGLLRERVADLIGLGRPLRADFKWVQKAKNQNQRIISCMNCNWWILLMR